MTMETLGVISEAAAPCLAPGHLQQTTWPPEPEGFDYRFCLPSTPVVHFFREKATGMLVAFHILNGSFRRKLATGRVGVNEAV